MEKDWLDQVQAGERAGLEREIQEAAARNRLIAAEAPRVFEALLASFRRAAFNNKVSGVTLRVERPERDLGRLIATVHRGATPLKTSVDIQLDPDTQEIRCSSQVGGTEMFYFGVVSPGTVCLFRDGRPVYKIDSVPEMVLRPLVTAVKALH